MGIVKRQSIKATIVIYVGIAVGYFNMMWLSPKFLQPEEIGLLRFLVNTAALLLPVAQLGMSQTINRFYPYYKDSKDFFGFLTYILVLPTVGLAIVSLILIFFQKPILSLFTANAELAVSYMYVIIPLTLLMMYFSIFTSLSRSNMRIVVPNIIEEVAIRLMITVAIVLYALHLVQFGAIVHSYLVIYSIALVAVFIYVNRLRTLRISISGMKKLGRNSVQKLLSFGTLSMMVNLGGGIISKIDVIMLASMSGLKDAGIYSIAFVLGSVIEIPRRAISQISIPIIADSWKNNDVSRIGVLYQRSSLNQFIPACLLFLLIWCNADNILVIMPKSDIFSEGKYVIFFIGVSRLIDLTAGLNVQILAYSRYYYLNNPFLALIAAVTIGLNLYFIPRWGITGAAAAAAISVLIFNFAYFVFLLLKFRLQPFTPAILWALGIGGFGYLVGMIIPKIDGPWADMVIRSMIITCAFALPVYFFKVSHEVNSSVNVFLAKLRSRLK